MREIITRCVSEGQESCTNRFNPSLTRRVVIAREIPPQSSKTRNFKISKRGFRSNDRQIHGMDNTHPMIYRDYFIRIRISKALSSSNAELLSGN